jgi:putative restriction endonuclease
MPLSAEKRELMARVQDAINSSGWQMIFEDDEHPCPIRAFRGGETVRMLVYIWRLTRGGPVGVRPAGEFRIQITSVDAPLRTERARVTLLLGWHEDLEVFAGFDVTRRLERWGASPSVQIREDTLRLATASGFGFYRRATRTPELAVAFTPECFMDYVTNQARFHEFAEHPDEVRLLNHLTREDEDIDGEPHVDLDRIGSHGRRQVVRSVSERVGQENFRARVLRAYRRHCAMCALQLDLVVAAHIVPVKADGTNETTNGLALCYLHHEAYDRGFVIPDHERQIRVNDAALGRLRRIQRNSREREFLDNLRADLLLPERDKDYPSAEYLRRGMELRGWPVHAA